MNKLLLTLAVVFTVGSAQAQNFPNLTGTSLENKTVTIPKNTQGKYTIVGLVYSQKATEVLAPWFQNVYNYFIADPDYDLNVFFVPMLGGVKEAAAGSLEKELKKGTPPELYKHVLIYKGDVGSYKSALKMDQKDIPYIFVIDKQGKIIYQTSGAYSDEKIEKMDELVAEEEEE
jgi:hypothetical protein